MVQWTECDNRFVNPPSFPWLSENSGAIHLALSGLTAGRQADETQANLDILKFIVHRNFRLLALFNQGVASL